MFGLYSYHCHVSSLALSCHIVSWVVIYFPYSFLTLWLSECSGLYQECYEDVCLPGCWAMWYDIYLSICRNLLLPSSGRKDSQPHSHCCENLKSCLGMFMFCLCFQVYSWDVRHSSKYSTCLDSVWGPSWTDHIVCYEHTNQPENTGFVSIWRI